VSLALRFLACMVPLANTLLSEAKPFLAPVGADSLASLGLRSALAANSSAGDAISAEDADAVPNLEDMRLNEDRRRREKAHAELMQKRLFILCGIAGLIMGILVWQFVLGGKPCNLLWFAPDATELLPQAFFSVQDVDHLMLIILFFSSIVACAISLMYLWEKKGWVLEVVGLCIYIPCLSYVYACIRSYDNRLCTRREEVEKRREEIADLYQHMLEDCEKKLQKATESNAGLAEQHFESRKRDFGRFLDWVAEQDFGGGPGEPSVSAQVFERFIRLWLHAFEETSVDPVWNPRLGGGDGFTKYFENCQGVAANAKELRMALTHENVEFIKVERDLLMRKKKRHTKNQEKSLMRKCYTPIKAVRKRAVDVFRPPTWIAVGNVGFGVEVLETLYATAEETAFPVRFRIGCVSLVFVSFAHITIFIGFFMGPILCALYIFDGINRRFYEPEVSHLAIQTCLSLFTLCMFIILWDFERIDALMRLEQEIAVLDAERQEVIQQRVRIGEFFGKSQALVDFWITRTLPLLDLLKAVHERIEDTYRQDKIASIAEINRACDLLDQLFAQIGEIEVWKDAMNGDWVDVGEAKKEVIKGYVKQMINSGDLHECLNIMEERLASVRCVDFLEHVRDRAPSGMSASSSSVMGSKTIKASSKLGAGSSFHSRSPRKMT